MAQKQDDVSLKIAAIYAVTGISWILLSDKALEFVGLDQATATRVSIFKGWLYVLLTSALLYWLIRRHTGAIRKAGDLLRERNQELSSMGEQLRQNLAENIQSQQKLFASNQTLKAIFSASPIAIVAIDRDGMVTLWNKAAEKATRVCSESSWKTC
jgi:PAS domain-containing protein